MYRCSIIKAEGCVFNSTVWYQSYQHKSYRASRKRSFIPLPLTPVTNHSASCFSWLSPPNILVKMMMSDRDFYISPQLTSHPWSPSTSLQDEGWHMPVSHSPRLFPLPPLSPADTQACRHQCHSQLPSSSMRLHLAQLTAHGDTARQNQEHIKLATCQNKQHLWLFENAVIH